VIGEYVRLAVATAVVLLPGRLVARALGQRSVSATLAWAFASLFAAWAIVFAVHASIWLALGVLAAIGAGALLAAPRPQSWVPDEPGRAWVLLGGIVLGLLLWHVEGIVSGDGLFHLARVRKLVDLGDLHLRSVDELASGGLHPGYAFPLWHGFLACVTKISGLDPEVVLRHESSLLAPLAVAVAWEAGTVLFGSAFGGLGVLAASLATFCFAAGNGGAYTVLALPATGSRQLLVPAGIALFFVFAGSGRAADAAALAALFGALALVHPTYALFALIPLAAYAVVRFAEWRRALIALVCAVAPAALVFLWLRPLVDETISHNPSESEQRRALHHYAGELVVSSIDHYRLAASVLGRTGSVAVAALVLVPLAGLAARKRWGAYVLGGTVSVLAIVLVPALFSHFADAVSLSQARRAAGFAPLPFAFAGGLALLTRSYALAPLALVGGYLLEREWPGDFAYGLRKGGPPVVTWFALIGGAVALVVGLVFSSPEVIERWRRGALAAWLFVLPVAVHGFRHWSPLVTSDPYALTPALVRELEQVPPRAVIIASPQTSYHLVAAAPVYVVASPPTHVADTKANDPKRRRRDWLRFLHSGDAAIPRGYGAGWVVLRGRERLRGGGRLVYRDSVFRVYRL
jgi:hypothetical protein